MCAIVICTNKNGQVRRCNALLDLTLTNQTGLNMAAVIESQIRQELEDFQSLVDAIRGAGVVAPYVPACLAESFGYVFEYLGAQLWGDFERLQGSIAGGVAPFSSGVSLVVDNEEA